MSGEKKFTAVIYFHGIGQQSRYEELSRLLESFDDYSLVQEDNRLERFQVKVEPSRSDITNDNIGYVTFNRDGEEYRFYEVYWAPLTTTGTTGWGVFKWFIGHIFTPLTIWQSEWHTHRRLRISYLYSLWQKLHPNSPQFIPLQKLIALYNDFCDEAMRGRKRDGKYSEFVKYLKSEAENDDKDGLLTLTHQWRRHMNRTEFWNFFVFLTIGYILTVVPIMTIGRILYLTFYELSFENFLSNDPLAIIFYVTLFLILPLPSLVARFLRDYVGDVQLWATYEETSEKFAKRTEILKTGLETTTHVLNHNGCERVIFVSHSLGTTIAYDTLLTIGRHNRAIDNASQFETDEAEPDNIRYLGTGGGGLPLPMTLSKNGEKIDTSNIRYFVTMGSPVDKIHYFFESKSGLYRPFELITDDIRGDISSSPFARENGVPNFRWINFWSQEDYVSGALYTPNPRKFTMREQAVNNVLIKSHHFPAPARSHVGYFRHNTVIGLLYRLIFQRMDSNTTLMLKETVQARPQVQGQTIRNVMLILTWTLLFAIVFDIMQLVLLYQIFSVVFMGLLSVILGAAIISLSRGALKPFKKGN